jgi:aspartyl-tRNA(Asn)/glutamyl-tRNA(Gln) amidotransferase subunit A
LPAISVPFATHSNGMPLGIQLMGRPFAEAEVFALAKVLQD